MGKTYSRVQRGQVYWFDPTKTYGGFDSFTGFNGRNYSSSIQIRNRPWLVVSNNTGNSNSPTCNIVPITTEDKTSIPVHVYFTYEGKQQTILTEQIRTVDSLALGDYIYTLSDEIMEKVERAMQIQFDIRPQISYTDFHLDNTITQLETIISNIISTKVEQVKQEIQSQIPISQVEDTALKLGEMIEDLVGGITPSTPVSSVKKPKTIISKPQKEENPKISQLQETKEKSKPIAHQPQYYKGMSAVEKFNARYNRPQQNQSQPTNPSSSVGSKKRNTWTIERRKTYLEDCEKLSPQEIKIKYGFSSLQSVFQTKYQCKNALIKAGILKVED